MLLLLEPKRGALTFLTIRNQQPIMPTKLLHKELEKSSFLFSRMEKCGCFLTFKSTQL